MDSSKWAIPGSVELLINNLNSTVVVLLIASVALTMNIEPDNDLTRPSVNSTQ